MIRCVICQRVREHRGVSLCLDCGRAFDRWNRTAECTHIALMEWTAERAQRFAGVAVFSRSDLLDLDQVLGGRVDGAEDTSLTRRLIRIRRKIQQVIRGGQ